MPESSPPPDALDDAGVVAHERFVQESIEIDQAHEQGRLDEWLTKKVADERRAAGYDPSPAG